MDNFYCCYVDGTVGFSHRYPTWESARIEAERLASQPWNHGKKVYVLEVVAVAQVKPTPVTWEGKALYV